MLRRARDALTANPVLTFAKIYTVCLGRTAFLKNSPIAAKSTAGKTRLHGKPGKCSLREYKNFDIRKIIKYITYLKSINYK